MTTISLTNAKAHLSALVQQAADGHPVRITRHGKPIAEIRALETPRKPIDLAALRALTDAMPLQPTTDWSRLRDEERY